MIVDPILFELLADVLSVLDRELEILLALSHMPVDCWRKFPHQWEAMIGPAGSCNHPTIAVPAKVRVESRWVTSQPLLRLSGKRKLGALDSLSVDPAKERSK